MTAYLATFELILEFEAETEEAAVELAERAIGEWEPIPEVSILRADLGDIEEYS